MNTNIFQSLFRIFLLLIFVGSFQGTTSLNAQTRTFRGTESALWDNPFNWEPFGLLPVASEDVVIDPSGPHTDVIMNIDVNIRSLHVKTGSLTVPADKTLTISNSSSGLDGIKVAAGLINSGAINVTNAGGNGVVVTGIFLNMANLAIGQNSGSIELDGINVATSLINSGTINITGTKGNGVSITGSFVNRANLFVGQNSGSIGLHGINIKSATGNLNNDGGTIAIGNNGTESNNKNGILNEGGQLTNQNSGEIQIGQSGGMIAGKGLVGLGNGTSFINDGSTIKIDNTGTNDPTSAGSAIWLVNAVMFENKGGGQILIGQNDGNIGRDGITMGVNNSVFKNTDGVVTIDNTGLNTVGFGRGVDIGAGSTFLNEVAGQLLIGQNDGQIKSSGITISNATAVFTNDGGLVKIDQTGTNNNGFAATISLIGSAFPQFTNKNDGQIWLGLIGGNANGRAIYNNGVFSNEGCSSSIFILSNDVIINDHIFTNEGAILETASGNSNITNNSGIIQNLNGGTFTIDTGNPAVNDGSTFIWQGCVNSDWENPDNWFMNAVPGTGDKVAIFNSPNDPVINTGVILGLLYVGTDAQLTIHDTGVLHQVGGTSNSIMNDGMILNQGSIRIVSALPNPAAFLNRGVFTNANCGLLNVSGPLNNSGSIINNGFAVFSTLYLHSNTGTFINNGVLETQGSSILSVTNNEIIIQPTTANACADISPAFDLGEHLNFNILGIFTDADGTNSAGSFDAATNTFSPNTALEEGTHFFAVKVEDPVGGCTDIVLWKLITQNCCDLPAAACQSYEAALDGNGQVSITAAAVDGGSTADCGLQSLSIELENFDCSHVGTPQLVELTVTDVNGDSDQCTATVTVVDNELPTPVCLNPIVEFNGEAEIFLEITQVWDEANSSDNCGGIYFIGMSPDKVTCEQLGTIVPITITVEDASGNTTECTANVTVGGLPCGWNAQPDGINCTNGNQAAYNPNSNIFSVTSEGCYDPNYYSNSDSHGFVGTELCGDGEIIAQVTHVEGNGWAGVSMREGSGASDKKLQLLIDGTSLTRRELRQSKGAVAYAHQFLTQGKNWLRLTRSGNTFGAYHSLDGINWQAVLITNIPMSNCIDIGLVTRNGSPSGTTTGTFENVTINSTSSLQAPGHNGLDIAASPSPTLEVYPNPAKGEAWIELGQFNQLMNQELAIEVFNNLGQLIQSVPAEEIGNPRIYLDLQGWQPGLYLVKVRTGEQPLMTKKLVVSE